MRDAVARAYRRDFRGSRALRVSVIFASARLRCRLRFFSPQRAADVVDEALRFRALLCFNAVKQRADFLVESGLRQFIRTEVADALHYLFPELAHLWIIPFFKIPAYADRGVCGAAYDADFVRFPFARYYGWAFYAVVRRFALAHFFPLIHSVPDRDASKRAAFYLAEDRVGGLVFVEGQPARAFLCRRVEPDVVHAAYDLPHVVVIEADAYLAEAGKVYRFRRVVEYLAVPASIPVVIPADAGRRRKRELDRPRALFR